MIGIGNHECLKDMALGKIDKRDVDLVITTTAIQAKKPGQDGDRFYELITHMTEQETWEDSEQVPFENLFQPYTPQLRKIFEPRALGLTWAPEKNQPSNWITISGPGAKYCYRCRAVAYANGHKLQKTVRKEDVGFYDQDDKSQFIIPAVCKKHKLEGY